jgi:uncharacterized protein YggE
MFSAFSSLVVCISALALPNVPAPEARTITVSGQASVKVVPDRVIIVIGVEIMNKDLAAAKKEHDERIKKLLALPARFQIDPKDVQTDYARIEIAYRYEYSRRQFDGYQVSQSIAFTLRDVSKYDALLTAALECGANLLDQISFQTSDLRQHRDQARALAVQAAKEHAASWWYGGGWRGGNAAFENRQVQFSPETEPPSLDGTIALGQVRVDANVSVTFELVDRKAQ